MWGNIGFTLLVCGASEEFLCSLVPWMNDMSLKEHFKLRCVHEDSREPKIRLWKLLKKKKRRGRGICELLNVVLEQPVRLRPENDLGREKEDGNGTAKGFILHFVNLEWRGHISSRVEGASGTMAVGLGVQTLMFPVVLPELNLHRACLEVITDALPAAVTTGNGQCAVKVHLRSPAPLKTSTFTSLSGNWKGRDEDRSDNVISGHPNGGDGSAAARTLIPSSSLTSLCPSTCFPSGLRVILGLFLTEKWTLINISFSCGRGNLEISNQNLFLLQQLEDLPSLFGGTSWPKAEMGAGSFTDSGSGG